MYYLYNPTNERLYDPDTGIEIKPGEVRKFEKSEEGAFMRFSAIFNGVVRIVDENFYLTYTSKQETSKRKGRPPKGETSSEEQEQTEE